MDEREKKEMVSPPKENRFLKLRREKDKAAILKKTSQFEDYRKLRASRDKEYRVKLAKAREILVDDIISEIKSLNEVEMSKPGFLQFKSEAFADFIPDDKGITEDRGRTATFLDKSGNVVRSKDELKLQPMEKWQKLYQTSPMSQTTYHKLLTSVDQRLTCIIGAKEIGILNQDHHDPNEVRMFRHKSHLHGRSDNCCLSPDGNTLISIGSNGSIHSIDLLKGKVDKIFDAGKIPGFLNIGATKFRMDNISMIASTPTNIFEINTLTWKFKKIYTVNNDEERIAAIDINEVNGDIAVASNTQLTIITEKGTMNSCIFNYAPHRHESNKNLWNYISFSDMSCRGLRIVSPKMLLTVGSNFYNALRKDDCPGNEPCIGRYVKAIAGIKISRAVPSASGLNSIIYIENENIPWAVAAPSQNTIENNSIGRIFKMKNQIRYKNERGSGGELGKTMKEEGYKMSSHQCWGYIQPRTITYMRSRHSMIFETFDSIAHEMEQAGMNLKTNNGIDFHLSWFAHGSIE